MVTNKRQPGEPGASLLVEQWAEQTFAILQLKACVRDQAISDRQNPNWWRWRILRLRRKSGQKDNGGPVESSCHKLSQNIWLVWAKPSYREEKIGWMLNIHPVKMELLDCKILRKAGSRDVNKRNYSALNKPPGIRDSEQGAVSVGSPSQAAAEGALLQWRDLNFLQLDEEGSHSDHSPHSAQVPPAEKKKKEQTFTISGHSPSIPG